MFSETGQEFLNNEDSLFFFKNKTSDKKNQRIKQNKTDNDRHCFIIWASTQILSLER